MRTPGNLIKPVVTGDIGPPDGSGAPDGQTWGIVVGGTIEQPISVARRVLVSKISAADYSSDADVTIGAYLKGTVEARSETGTLRTVSVGLSAASGTPLTELGMNGWSDADTDPPSVISAPTIESVSVVRMHLSGKDTPPQISGDLIEYFWIGKMVRGEVSGWRQPNDPPTYAIFGTAEIEEISARRTLILGEPPPPPTVDRPVIWCGGFDSFEVRGGHAGIINLLSVPADRALRIGDGMRNLAEGSAAYVDGTVTIGQNQGLAGAVIINAEGATDPDPAEYCSGPVIIEDGTTDISLSAAASTGNLNTMPEYTRTSGTIGGGAVGLAPFYLYEADCYPLPGATGTDALLQSEFDNVSTDSVPTRPVIVRFYGPVRTDLVSDSPVDLYLRKVLNNTISFTRMPRDSYTVEVNRPGSTGANREIRLYGAGQYRFSSGQYHIRPRESGPPQLYCDFVKFNPAVRDFDYIFDLRLDCDYDGTEDQPWECGVICAAGDFNQDGGVDGADVETFFIAWENADPSADVNQDGGIDGRDVETFFIAWEAGGC